MLSGMGVGGGTLLVLYLVWIAGVSQLDAQGINLLYFLPVASASLAGHIKNRLIEVRCFFFAAGAGLFFSAAGSLLAPRAGEAVLRRVFGALLIAGGVYAFFGAKKKDKQLPPGGK